MKSGFFVTWMLTRRSFTSLHLPSTRPRLVGMETETAGKAPVTVPPFSSIMRSASPISGSGSTGRSKL